MTHKEIDFFGVYVAPIALDILVAAVLFAPLRLALSRIGIERFVWHRPLFETAVYVMLLAIVELGT
jgi:hypothetical protein